VTTDKIPSIKQAWTPRCCVAGDGDAERLIKKARFFSAALWSEMFSLAYDQQAAAARIFARSLAMLSGDSIYAATTLELH
jgi:hypothetical protein